MKLLFVLSIAIALALSAPAEHGETKVEPVVISHVQPAPVVATHPEPAKPVSEAQTVHTAQTPVDQHKVAETPAAPVAVAAHPELVKHDPEVHQAPAVPAAKPTTEQKPKEVETHTAPVVPAQTEKKPVAETPVSHTKPEDKPAPKAMETHAAPVLQPHTESKPVAEAPIAHPKAEEKHVVKVPVPHPKPEEKHSPNVTDINVAPVVLAHTESKTVAEVHHVQVSQEKSKLADNHTVPKPVTEEKPKDPHMEYIAKRLQGVKIPPPPEHHRNVSQKRVLSDRLLEVFDAMVEETQAGHEILRAIQQHKLACLADRLHDKMNIMANQCELLLIQASRPKRPDYLGDRFGRRRYGEDDDDHYEPYLAMRYGGSRYGGYSGRMPFDDPFGRRGFGGFRNTAEEESMKMKPIPKVVVTPAPVTERHIPDFHHHAGKSRQELKEEFKKNNPSAAKKDEKKKPKDAEKAKVAEEKKKSKKVNAASSAHQEHKKKDEHRVQSAKQQHKIEEHHTHTTKQQHKTEEHHMLSAKQQHKTEAHHQLTKKTETEHPLHKRSIWDDGDEELKEIKDVKPTEPVESKKTQEAKCFMKTMRDYQNKLSPEKCRYEIEASTLTPKEKKETLAEFNKCAAPYIAELAKTSGKENHAKFPSFNDFKIVGCFLKALGQTGCKMMEN